jgi:hypothetical protein
MKIQTDQIAPTQQSGRVQTAKSAQATNFGEILAKEVDGSQPAAGSAALSSLAGVTGLAQAVAAHAAEKVADVSSERQAVMDNVDGILNQWEKYSGQLTSGSSTQLRQAYGTLETIQADVKKLKDEYPDLDGHSPQLSSLVNELEVMTVTEQIKYNRGDYL